MAVLLAACGSSTSDPDDGSSSSAAEDGETNEEVDGTGDSEEEPSGELVIGVQVLSASQPFYQSYANAWEQLAADEGFTAVILDNDANVSTQLDNFDDLMARGVDAIVLSPVDEASGVPLVDRAIEDGVPIVTIAVDTGEAPVVVEDSFQGGFDGGVRAAEWVLDNRPEWTASAVVGVCGYPTLQQTVDRADGFVEGVASLLPDSTVSQRAECFGVLDQATQVADDMIQANPETNIWFGINDDSALGVLRALESAGRGTVETDLVVGYDGSPPVLQEVLNPESALKLSVGNGPGNQALVAYDLIRRMVAGEEVEQRTEYTVQVLGPELSAAELEEYALVQYGIEISLE